MPFESFTNQQLIKEVKRIKESHENVFSQQFKDLLTEVEKRLGAKGHSHSKEKKEAHPKNKKPTKKDIYIKYLYS